MFLSLWAKLKPFLDLLVNGFYWILLVLWLVIVFNKKLKAKSSFVLGFSLTLLSAVFDVFGFLETSEFLIRLGFIFWIIGLIMAIIELKRSHD